MGSKIVAEVAEQEFLRFAEEMDLDIDVSGMDDDDRAGLEEQKRKVVNAIKKGSLTVGDKGELTFTPSEPNDAEPITFREPTGATMLAMDKAKKNADVAKLAGVMASMTSTSPKLFAKMLIRDYKVCTAIVTLFLG